MTISSRPRIVAKRYQLVCVAPEVPGLGSFDDPDQAIVNCPANFDVWDSKLDVYLSPTCWDDVDFAAQRLRRKSTRWGRLWLRFTDWREGRDENGMLP